MGESRSMKLFRCNNGGKVNGHGALLQKKKKKHLIYERPKICPSRTRVGNTVITHLSLGSSVIPVEV
jgi:hypothetical protein